MKNRVLPFIVLTVVLFSFTIPLIFRPATIIYAAENSDERGHYQQIVAFKQQFPNFNFNYNLPYTPLYHIVFALITFVFGSKIFTLRFINLIISAACPLIVYGYLAKRGGLFKALIFTTVFMLSPYFWGPAVRLVTDNLALLFALLSILLMDSIHFPGIGRSLLVSISILLAVLTRQIYAWLIGVYLLITYLKWKGKPLTRNLAWILLPSLIPIIGLGYFLFLWKGLTPPALATYTAKSLNWESPMFTVSLLGLYSCFIVFWLLEMYRDTQTKLSHIIVLIGLGVVCLLLHPVYNWYGHVGDYDRGGSLWFVATLLPNIFSTSILFWVLFPLGIVCLYIFTRHLISKHNYLMVICFLLWLITSMINARTYQKYNEPFTLFFMAYAIMDVKEKRYYWVGPVLLIMGFMSLTLVGFFV